MPRPPSRKRKVASARPKEVRALTIQTEDYLERIQGLLDRKGYARVSDIAEELHLTPSTVSNMVRRLARHDLIEFENYRGLRLTDRGRAVARRIQARHATLAEFFESLGIDPKDARKDVEGIEHHISSSTLNALEALTKALEKYPAVLAEVRRRKSSG
jgi:Mn-dependent DtxR family transcriptional regulator